MLFQESAAGTISGWLWLLTCSSVAIAAGPPALCLNASVPQNPIAGQICYFQNTIVEIDVDMTFSEKKVCGAQFFLEYDVSALSFIEIIKGADVPNNPNGAVFNTVLFSEVDPLAGNIDYVVGGNPGQLCAATSGPVTIARLRFEAIGVCESMGVCFRPHNPPTVLGADDGSAINPTACNDPAGEVAGSCTPVLHIIPDRSGPICPCKCDDDAHCDDGRSCNGIERCIGGICRPGTNPCTGPDLPFCNIETDQCVQCLVDADAEDGLLCTYDQCIGGVVTNTDITDPPPPGSPGHFDCDSEANPDEFCQGVGGLSCEPDGSCLCFALPALCLTAPVNPVTGDPFFSGNTEIDVDMTFSGRKVCGAQFFLEYSASALSFVGIIKGADVPDNPNGAVFNTILLSDVDPVAGTIDYVIGDAPLSNCGNATNGPATIARIRFEGNGSCDSDCVCVRLHNPATLLAAEDGVRIDPTACHNPLGDVVGSCTAPPLPTVSKWGLRVMTILLLTGMTIKFGRRHSDPACTGGD